jgi:hypothetical protein
MVELGSHSKNLVDEEDPFFDGSFRYSLNLSFPHHVHDLVVLQKLVIGINQ